MLNLAPLDIGIIATFFLAVIALGFSVRAKKDALGFLAAGRALTLPAFIATLVSTWYGGILGIGESAAFFGAGTWLLIGVPYYAFGILYALVLAPRVREADALSIPDRLEQRFGTRPALVAGGLLFLLGIPAAHVLMIGALLEAFTGLPLLLCILAATGIGGAFVIKGGLLADVRVSILAFIFMFLGFAIAAGTALSQKTLPTLIAALPPEQQSFTGSQNILTILTFFILGAWTLIDPAFHQRVASAATPQTGKRGVLLSVVCWVIFDFLSITTALYAVTQLQQTPESPLLLFPAFAEQLLTPGLKGLFLVGMAGTILSACTGYALISGASLGRDVFARIKPAANPVTSARIGTAIALAVACLVGAWLQSVVSIWYAWSGAIIGAILWSALSSYGVIRIQRSPPAHAAAMIAGFTVALAWLIYGFATGNPYLSVTLAGQSFGLGTLIPGAVVSALVLILAPKHSPTTSKQTTATP